jgi:YVTN family beta-propeller protein
MRTRITSLLLFTIAVSLCLAGIASGQAKLPTAAGTITIGGEGGWDYLLVDTTARRLYVSHGTSVPVIDLDQSKVTTTIPNTTGVHGIALAPEFGRGFISDGRDTAVTVFDLKTDSTIAKILVTGQNPDAILYDPFSAHVFTFNGRSSNATVIDAKTLKVIGTIPLAGKPEFAASDYKGRVYVNIEDKSLLCVIDPKEMKVLSTWSLAPLEEPSAMAIDRKNNRLFIGGGNEMLAVVNAEDGKLIATLPIGKGVDGAAFDPEKRLVYSSNGVGTLTVIAQESPDKYSVVGNVTTLPRARTVALDERTHRLYLAVRPASDSGSTVVKDFEILIYQQ